MRGFKHWARRMRRIELVAREGNYPTTMVAEELQMTGEELGLSLAASRRPEQGNIFSA